MKFIYEGLSSVSEYTVCFHLNIEPANRKLRTYLLIHKILKNLSALTSNLSANLTIDCYLHCDLSYTMSSVFIKNKPNEKCFIRVRHKYFFVLLPTF